MPPVRNTSVVRSDKDSSSEESFELAYWREMYRDMLKCGASRRALDKVETIIYELDQIRVSNHKN